MAKLPGKDNLLEQYRKKQVNLLPDLYFKKKKRLRVAITSGLIVALILSFFAYQLVSLYEELGEIRAQNELIEQAIRDKSEESKRQSLLDGLKKRIEFKVDLLKEIELSNTSALYVSQAIEESLPSGIVYVSVDFDSEKSISIVGRTSFKEEVPDLLNNLRMKNMFSKVSVESITKTSYTYYAGTEIYYDFMIICVFGGVDNEIN